VLLGSAPPASSYKSPLLFPSKTRVSRLFTNVFSYFVLLALPVSLVASVLFWMPSYDSWSAFEFKSHCLHTLYFDEPGFSPDEITWIRSDYPRQCARDLVQFMTIVSPVVLFLIMLLIGLGLSIFGRELLRGALMCEINSSSVPDHETNVTVRTLRDVDLEGSGLRHKLYDRPECAWMIARWLKRELLGGAVQAPRQDPQLQ
jgi:hypothetical protein